MQITFTSSTVFNSAGDFDNRFVGHAYQNTWSHQRQKKRMAKRLKLCEKDSKAIGTTAIEMEEISNTEKQIDSEQLRVSTITDTGSTDIVNLEKGTTRNLSKMGAEQSCTTSNSSNITQSTVTTGNVSNSVAERPGIGQKRTHESPDTPKQTSSDGDPLFKFEVIVSRTKDTRIVEESPVEVDVACLEGNREIVHQFFMHVRNRFNGEQIRSSKR